MQRRPSVSRREVLVAGKLLGSTCLIAWVTPKAFAAGDARADKLQKTSEFKPSAYIAVGADNAVTCVIGKSEMGQGTLTGIAQLLAAELGCAWKDLRVVQADANPLFGFPFNGFMATGGSTGLRSEWKRMRKMGAAARMMLQEAAAKEWRVAVDKTWVKDGVVYGPRGRQRQFGQLIRAAARNKVPEKVQLIATPGKSFIGQSMPRVDTHLKTTGRAVYGVDLELPGLRTAVVISAPKLMAKPKSFNGSKALKRPGVSQVIGISSGVAIVGDHYWAVHAAREDVTVDWHVSPLENLNTKEISASFQDALNKDGQMAQQTGRQDNLDGQISVTRTMVQPYLAHACMEPMNITVRIDAGRAEVWGPVQAQTLVQKAVGKVAGIDPKQVTVHTTFLGGGFGRRSAVDFVVAAAEIALSVKGPVKLIYSREDDMRAGRYRPFSAATVTGALDGNGNLTSLDAKVAVPSVSKLSGFPFLVRKDGIDPQAVEGLVDLPYDVPDTRVRWVDHDVGVPVHFWRSVGASHNPFILETLIDELAIKAGTSPLQFRQKLLRKRPRHLAVLNRLSKIAGLEQPVPKSVGRGLAIVQSFGSIVAEAVEVRLVEESLRVDKVYCVVDCGIAVNPNQISAQMESSIVYGLSAFLRGQITIAQGEVEQSNFHDYEPLRFPDMPKIKVDILQNGDKPGGIGEPGLPPLLPAVANAMFNLTGRSIETLPLNA